MRKIISAIIILTFLGCKSERGFKEVKNISEYKKTAFVVALEQEIPQSKNAIYASSLLYAWDKLSSNHNISNIDNSNNELSLLNSSSSFKNSLKEDEVNFETNYSENKISIKAFFNKSLPFNYNLERFSEPLLFNKSKVENFGFHGYNSETSSIAQILYYKNDNDFILKLNSKELEHEIIILKSEIKSFKNLNKIISEIKNKTLIGNTELKNQNKAWKYQFLDEDILKIPVINFNIEKSFLNLVGSKFLTNGGNTEITAIYQRTAFILDEKGVEIESEAEIEVAVEEIEEDVNKPKPKNFILDKPFAIILKRKDSKNPYFVCWINNIELMIKK